MFTTKCVMHELRSLGKEYAGGTLLTNPERQGEQSKECPMCWHVCWFPLALAAIPPRMLPAVAHYKLVVFM